MPRDARPPVALAAGLLLLAGLCAAPTASAGCLQVLNSSNNLSCFVCPATNASEVACAAERGVNAILLCVVAGLPNILVTCL